MVLKHIVVDLHEVGHYHNTLRLFNEFKQFHCKPIAFHDSEALD